jgi:hypothetical protein
MEEAMEEQQVIEPQVDYAAKEAELTLRENTLVARETLSKAGIPDSFLSIVVNADRATMDRNLELLTKEWSTAIKNAVTEKIKGKVPEMGAEAPARKWSEMSYHERVALKRTNPALYEAVKGQSL